MMSDDRALLNLPALAVAANAPQRENETAFITWLCAQISKGAMVDHDDVSPFPQAVSPGHGQVSFR
jgi:uncharacterized NAD(P)/FAD-binding protein YdhS